MSLKDSLYRAQLTLRQRLAARPGSAAVRIDPATFAPTKVLFVLSGLLGDSVMSLPAVEAGRELWPEARIYVLGKRHNRELIEGCGFYDEFIECGVDPFSLRARGEVRNLQLRLVAERFDAAFILLGDQFAPLLAKANIPVRVGTAGTVFDGCLTHTYDAATPRTWGTNERFNSLRCLGYEVAPKRPMLCSTPEARERAKNSLGDLGLEAHRPYVVFHPFGSTARQWWKPFEAAGLAEHLFESRGLSTVLVGGPENVSGAANLGGGPLVNTVGKLSIPELLAVIEGSAAVVTTDSGPFHIAGAFGRPTVGLLRSRRPEHAEAYPNGLAIFGRDDDCFETCDWDRCASRVCRQMNSIQLSEVNGALDTVLR